MDIDTVGEVSTFRAIQGYFNNEKLVSSCEEGTLNQQPSSPSDILLSTSPRSYLPSPSTEATVNLRAEQLSVPEESTPGLPSRNPKRLHFPSTSPKHTLTNSMHGLPNTPTEQKLVIPKRRAQDSTPEAQAARVGSSTLGRMAPPILGHVALCATADLNDLSYYLKNTGPTPEPQPHRRQRIQKKAGFKMFKASSSRKSSLAARVGSVESSPRSKVGTERQRTVTPACAKEMTTSSGTKHLEIMVPSDDFLTDQIITLPVSMQGEGQNRLSKCVSITWTEEMLNPLASPTLERVISKLNEPETKFRTAKSQRGPKIPKHSPIVRKPVPVRDEGHPLADVDRTSSRQEQTRARKLRDLNKARSRHSAESKDEDRILGAPHTIAKSPIFTTEHGTHKTETANERDEDELLGDLEDDIDAACRTDLLKDRVISLQRQNTELAEALARIVGFESEDGDLDPREVLSAYKRIKMGGGIDGSDEQRRGRVFTT